MPSPLKRILLGNPLSNDQFENQRLSNPVALAVFSSDALSSVAYATEEILLMLALAGTASFHLVLPIALAIGVLLVVVAISYRQTIGAYPNGGGAYIVAKENLGKIPGLVAGSSLLVDYVLTVAVSISAGTAAITSAVPSLAPLRVEIAVTLVLLIALANLRGVKESGAMFVGPTYFFVAMLAILIVVGLGRYAMGGTVTVPAASVPAVTSTGLTMFILLKAFASGCAAMTGIEAIANGVQAFRKPEADNARRTLAWMAGVLLFLFIGTSLLARFTGVAATDTGETVISQLARGVFGTGIVYYALQAATAAILVLAANTSYADFPRLASIMAADGFLPKQLKDRGTRLVHSNGMLLLTGMSVALIVIFGGDTHRLIPLYAVGVFTSFTLSQSGMVVHWLKSRDPGWHWSIGVNGAGAITTLIVLLVVVVAKFFLGAWVVVVLIPVLVIYLATIQRHYQSLKGRLALPIGRMPWQGRHRKVHNHVVMLIGSIDKRLLRTMEYVRAIKADTVQAVYVDLTGDSAEEFRAAYENAHIPYPLEILESPYRQLIEPLRDFIRSIPRHGPGDMITVLLPDFVPQDFGDFVLHDQTSFFVHRALLMESDVVVTDVPYCADDEPEDFEGDAEVLGQEPDASTR